MPIKLSPDDPEVKKYLEKAVDQFSEEKKAMVKDVSATSYPPAGKLLYNIKFKMGSTNCTKGSDEKNCQHIPEAGFDTCELNVFNVETDKEPMVTSECSRVGRRRRDDGQPDIADLPTDLKIDDPEVKKYAQLAVDKLGGHSSGTKGIVSRIEEAKSYPPSGKLLYKIKLKIGATKCPKDSKEDCEYDPEPGDDNCEISIFNVADKENSAAIMCWKVGRRRRRAADDDGEPQIADFPSKPSVDDPQVKLYAGKGVDKLKATGIGPADPVLEKILEATFFPPAGKLLYEIKIKVGSKQNKQADSQDCKVNVWRESDGEPSVEVECG